MFDYAAYAKALREELHQIPEIGFDLPKTLAVVHRELEAMGLSYTDKYGPSSVVAVINDDKPFTIGLRADMDALPIQEKNEVPYKSKHEGCSHACGHDSHTALLLAAAKLLVDRKEELNCRVKLMFTPAEEYETPGCSILAENGIMDDVNCAIAMHVNSDREVGHFTFTDEDVGGNSLGFKVRFYGKSAHAAGQQKGKDAILMAVKAITDMEFMAAKEIDVAKPRLLNIGSIHGGQTNNVICDYVEIFGSCRTAEDEVGDYMEARIQEICEGVARISGGRAEYERVKFLPYRVNNPILYRAVYASASKRFSEDQLHRFAKRGLGGEDFGFLTRKKPCLFVNFGVKGKGVEKASPVHSTTFDIDPESYQPVLDFVTGFVFDNMNGIEGL